MKVSLIIDNDSEVELLKECVLWFLETQDPELNDTVYDRNDRIILRDILLPRIECPFDVNDGTSKDLGLLTQSLETALTSGAIASERAQDLLQRLTAYACRERQRLGKI